MNLYLSKHQYHVWQSAFNFVVQLTEDFIKLWLQDCLKTIESKPNII